MYSLLFIYHTIPAWFHANGGGSKDFAFLWNILCEGSTSLAADPFGYMECLYLYAPNICSEKNIFCYIVSEIEQIGHIEILMHLLPKFSWFSGHLISQIFYISKSNNKTCFLWNFRMSALPDWAKNNFYFLYALQNRK